MSATIREQMKQQTPIKRQPNPVNAEFRYQTPEDIFKLSSLTGEPVPQGYVMFSAYDTEFLIHESVTSAGMLTTSAMREKLKAFATYHKNRALRLKVTSNGRIIAVDTTAILCSPKRYSMYGHDIEAEPGIIRERSNEDRKWLETLIEYMMKQRCVLYTFDGRPVDVKNPEMLGRIPV